MAAADEEKIVHNIRWAPHEVQWFISAWRFEPSGSSSDAYSTLTVSVWGRATWLETSRRNKLLHFMWSSSDVVDYFLFLVVPFLCPALMPNVVFWDVRVVFWLSLGRWKHKVRVDWWGNLLHFRSSSFLSICVSLLVPFNYVIMLLCLLLLW